MRKITMVLTFLLAFSTVSYAQFPESFEGTTFPPTGWTSFIGANGLGTAQNWQRSTTFFNTGVASAHVRYEAGTGGITQDWLVTPQVAITAANSNLVFSQRQQYTTQYLTVYTVRVSTTSQTDIASFTTVSTQSEADLGFAFGVKNVDLSAYVGQSVYVAFVMEQNDDDNWYIDDVNFTAAAAPVPDCSTVISPADAAVDVPTGDVTFSWNVPTTGPAPTSYDMYYGLTETTVTNLVGNFTTTTAEITLTGYDTTFYWKIVPIGAGGSATGCPVWSFTTESAPPAPDNDACSTATAITSLPYTNTQNAVSATNNDDFILGCEENDYGGMNDGVWYTVQGNGFDLTVAVTATTGWDPQVDVYSGSCGSFTCVASEDTGLANDGETVIIPASEVGTTYYINIGYWSDTTDGAEGPLTINVTSATSDTPDYANLQWPVTMTVTEGSTDNVYGQIYHEGLTEAAGQAAGVEAWVAVSADNTDPSTWDPFLFEPMTFNGQVNNNDEYVLAIGGDQAPGTYYYATRWRLNNGPFVYGGITSTGDGGAWNGTTYNSGVLTVNAAPAPANDSCATPTLLTAGGVFDDNDINTTSLGATVDAANPIPGCGAFNFDTVGKDVWYSVAIPASGSLTIMTDAPGSLEDTAMEVYAGTCDSLGEPIDCNDDIDLFGGISYSSVELTERTPGEMILVRVWGYNGTSGTFRISAFDPSLGNPNFESNNFKAYPNPVKDVLNLSSLQNITNVAVYNLLGQQVVAKAMNASEGQIDMSTLSQGTYMVKVTANNEVKTIKVIKE